MSRAQEPVTIPGSSQCAGCDDASRVQDGPASGVASPASVLVVDDDPGVRHAMRRALERRGYRVHEADSGRDALAHLQARADVGFVVTDLVMAKGSGGWLLAQIGYEYPHLLSRTVVMSGASATTAAAHLASRWRCPVLAKPFSAPQLAGTLAQLGAT